MIPRVRFLAAGVAFSLAWAGGSARACEPVQDLLFINGTCICDENGNIQQTDATLWGSRRAFDNDSVNHQLKKDRPGKLEAIVLKVHNNETNQDFDIVEKIDNPTCTGLIPQQPAGLSSSAFFKIKGLQIMDDPRGKLCTFDNLSIVDKLIHTPKSQHFQITDLNGKLCEGETRSGDQWWLFYRICRSPLNGLGMSEKGDHLVTDTHLIINQDGNCIDDPVRPVKQPVEIPSTFEGPCL
jgi:hypothetical protein